MKKVIISGGGTGGHIYPALTIARAIQKQTAVEILYIGSKNGLESKIVPQEGIPFETLEIQSFARKLTTKNLVTIFKSSKALIKAIYIIKKFNPDVVIGTGGYVCGPMLMGAAILGVPTLIQEQNVIAGVTNKILGRMVNTVAIGYEEARKSFSKCKNVIYTGNPIREAIVTANREVGRKKLGLDNNEFAVLISGGSRGAKSINEAMIEVHKYFKEEKNIKLIHVTGSNGYEEVLEKLGIVNDSDVSEYGANSIIVKYLHEMPETLAAVDLAVFRAGAIGIAELSARGIPSILIPYPYAAEDHQTYNAKSLVMNGASKMIVDKALTGRELIADICDLKENPQILRSMASASLALGKPQAANDIASLALSIARK